MILAVEFDGTIVENKFPDIGKEMPFAIDSLKMLRAEGFQIILWTSRYGHSLDNAVLYCRQKGLEFYAVNKNYPEEDYDSKYVARKIVADVYIDSRNLGHLPSWGEIYQQLSGKTKAKKKERSFLKWLKS